MSNRFFTYLEKERRRLDEQLEHALSGRSDQVEVATLEQLRNIVDDQLTRWSRDLTTDGLVA